MLDDHMEQVLRETLPGDVTENRVLVLDKADASERGSRVNPGSGRRKESCRIINDFSFDPNVAGGVNVDPVTEEVPDCLCGEAMPAVLSEIQRD